MNRRACVYLVGAGPGDPDLLTVKASRLLQQADVVVYDRLVSADILSLIPVGTQRIYVGKSRGAHHYNQDAINELLVNLARRQRRVVRLKGGDPFVFGRGGEEALYLLAHDIDVQVVPGITAASSAAYAGIPLTHRGVANAVTFVTGHCREDAPLLLDWSALANADTTLVVYMGLHHLPEMARRLIAAGRAPETPAALIENGTTPLQREYVTTLARLPEDARAQAFRPPTLVIIGQVVDLARALQDVDPAAGRAEVGVAYG